MTLDPERVSVGTQVQLLSVGDQLCIGAGPRMRGGISVVNDQAGSCCSRLHFTKFYAKHDKISLHCILYIFSFLSLI